MSNLISIIDAISHLETSIPDTANCKKIIVDLLKWILEWNKDRSQNNRVFSFLREFQNGHRDRRVNVAFALDRDGNTSKGSKPNFIVIKLENTDMEFRNIHVDFDFTNSALSEPPNDLLQYLILRPSRAQSNHRRWIAECSNISRMGFDNFKRLFLVAYERKGGIP